MLLSERITTVCWVVGFVTGGRSTDVLNIYGRRRVADRFVLGQKVIGFEVSIHGCVGFCETITGV